MSTLEVACGMATDTHRKKKRTNLSIQEKKRLSEEIRDGKPVRDVGKKYGISPSQVYRILRNKGSPPVRSRDVPLHSKIGVNKAKFPIIDQAVFEWFCAMRTFRRGSTYKLLPISRELIKARAKHEAKVRNIVTFKASDGWFARWRWRYVVGKRVRLQGEAADVDLPAVELEMQRLRESLSKYPIDNIFNMDEAALFFRALPNKSYLMHDEGDPRKAGRGCKTMSSKERLTLILCANATGNRKIVPVVIGSAKKPRCFQHTQPCIPYFHQKNAWNDMKNFVKWWDEVFLPDIRVWTKDPVALLMDGFSGHDRNVKDPNVRTRKG